jgi:hypothetical protein
MKDEQPRIVVIPRDRKWSAQVTAVVINSTKGRKRFATFVLWVFGLAFLR